MRIHTNLTANLLNCELKEIKQLPLYANFNFFYSGWDQAVNEASEIYKGKVHNLLCDNCHSHVATSLDLMHYQESTNWNMVKLAIFMLIYSKYVSFSGFLKTWLPFLIILTITLVLGFTVN